MVDSTFHQNMYMKSFVNNDSESEHCLETRILLLISNDTFIKYEYESILSKYTILRIVGIFFCFFYSLMGKSLIFLSAE